MLTSINKETIHSIQETRLREYAQLYVDIEANFLQQIQQFGLPMAQQGEETLPWEALEKQGAQLRNDVKSIVHGHISPACVNCQLAEEAITFYVSLKCSRSCFFCFNPNQEGYQYYLQNHRDVVKELEDLHSKGIKYRHIALSGGEPLLHKEETEAFLIRAKELYPKAYTRVYTSGDFLDQEYLEVLARTKLDEIRFSIKTDDSRESQEQTFARIALAKKYIPSVMVEMPVMPEEKEEMEALLLRLEEIGIKGINLLELCFPLNNGEVFRKKGYQIKASPYRVLYNYWYAGALPIAGSEALCCHLVQFALDHKFKMGVHYCSLENKQTGQVYQQNKTYKDTGLYLWSRRDYFLKSAKVFGAMSEEVAQFLEQSNIKPVQYHAQQQMVEFPIKAIKQMKKRYPDLEAAIAYYILEERDGESYLRELKLDVTTPATFDGKKDI